MLDEMISLHAVRQTDGVSQADVGTDSFNIQ